MKKKSLQKESDKHLKNSAAVVACTRNNQGKKARETKAAANGPNF